jgi:hypothetical protein
MALDLFKEVLPSLLQTKKPMLTPENEKEYKPYIVNRALSQHTDCILYVNEMNRFPSLDNQLQYDFYINILAAKKRPFKKWYKSSESTDIQAVKEYFGYSSEKAKDALRILSDEDIEYIKRILDKGGTVK